MNASLFLTFLLGTTVALANADILYIGDSHTSGLFGEVLDAQLRKTTNPNTQQPYRVQTISTCGSSTFSWLIDGQNKTGCGYRNCPVDGPAEKPCTVTPKGGSGTLKFALEAHQPKTTIVELGTNMLRNDHEVVMKSVRKMIGQINSAHAKCIWIGPAQARVEASPTRDFAIPIEFFNKYVKLLKDTVESEGCIFVDSATKTDRKDSTEPQGIHYSGSAAKKWAEAVYKEIKGPLSQKDAASATPEKKAGAQ